MPQKPFDVWAREEVARLRAEADALDRALQRYASAASRSAVTSGPTVSLVASSPVVPGAVVAAPVMAPGQYLDMTGGARRPSAERGTRGQRASKYNALFAKWAREAPAGLTLDEMQQSARKAGFDLARNVLRSTVWTQKQHGRVSLVGDRYVWRADAPQESQAVTDDPDGGL